MLIFPGLSLSYVAWFGLVPAIALFVRADSTREALAREIEGAGIPAAAAHFPDMRFGRLLPAAGRRTWVFD